MKVPEPKKLPSGSWFIRLRLGGESYPFTAPTQKQCRDMARTFKADYLIGRKIEAATKSEEEPETPQTIRQMFDAYLLNKDATLSPSTIRFYRTVQKHRFQTIMDIPPADVSKELWQKMVNDESKRYKPKTVRNSYMAIKTVVLDQSGVMLPRVTTPAKIVSTKKFLEPSEIQVFIKAVAPTKYAVPLLLALSSMRISEIDALDWQDIPKDAEFVTVKGARVLNEDNEYVTKAQNKNETSTRPIPILIPELKDAIERDRKKSGSVIPCSQNNLRLACHRICQQAGVTDVGVHELRHSFASLCYHLRVPEEIAMQIGGWSDAKTMREIYTHIAQEDIKHYKNALSDFFANSQKAE